MIAIGRNFLAPMPPEFSIYPPIPTGGISFNERFPPQQRRRIADTAHWLLQRIAPGLPEEGVLVSGFRGTLRYDDLYEYDRSRLDRGGTFLPMHRATAFGGILRPDEKENPLGDIGGPTETGGLAFYDAEELKEASIKKTTISVTTEGLYATTIAGWRDATLPYCRAVIFIASGEQTPTTLPQ